MYLSLHGASVVDGQAAPERALVQAVRDAAGRHVPVAASFDLHANAPPVDALDFSSAYRTDLHRDMRQTAVRANDPQPANGLTIASLPSITWPC